MSVAYSYLRISTPEQLRGDGIRRQLERTRAYAATRGLTLDESLRDIGVSAYKGRNRQSGALAGFLRLVEQGKIPRGSSLIVESLDRLSREKPMQALAQFLALVNAGIEIVTLVDNRVYNAESLDDSGLMLFGSLTVMCRAHDESKTKSDRVGAAWKRKHDRAKEKKVTARCPGWLRLSSSRDKFEIIPEKAKPLDEHLN